jgi:predicted nucleotidyltransferase
MEREQAIAALRAHEEEFRAAGVLSVSLFGSVARGENPAHDVDVVVRLGDSFSERGLDYISRLDDLEQRLSGILGCKVDVVEEPVRKQHVRRDNMAAKFWLEPVALERAGGFSRVELNAIARLVQAHRERFLKGWYEFFGR